MQRRCTADSPDRLWVTDITQHRTAQGWVYAAVVLDVFSRRVVGWSIADHVRTELVLDAPGSEEWVLECRRRVFRPEARLSRGRQTRPDRASALLREELPT